MPAAAAPTKCNSSCGTRWLPFVWINQVLMSHLWAHLIGTQGAQGSSAVKLVKALLESGLKVTAGIWSSQEKMQRSSAVKNRAFAHKSNIN
jgi:hypothetical protein